MKALVNRTNGIFINIDEDIVYLSHIKDNVAFTVKVPVNNSGTIEKWLCMHMSEGDWTHAYEKTVDSLNAMLHLNIPEKRMFKRTYKTRYFIDENEVHTSDCGEEFDSASMGIKLIVGEIDSISIMDDHYKVVVKSNMDMEVYEVVTDQLIFRFPMHTVNPNELDVLRLFKEEDCLLLLRKFSNLALQLLNARKITDTEKRSLLIDAARCNFNEDTLKKLAKVFIKYDDLALVRAINNNPVVGLLPNTLWVYYGIGKIAIWAHDNNGSVIEHVVLEA